MNPLEELGNFINSILTSIINILPDSPFRDFFVFVDEHEILGYVNWVIPFDNMAALLNTWIVCIAAYHVFLFVKGVLSGKNSIISRVFDAILG